MSWKDDPKLDEKGQVQILDKPKSKVDKPSMYKVLLLNDDYTPMDFVIQVLKEYFRKQEMEATQIMLQVHNQGAGLAGVFPFEIAETKVYQVNSHARKSKHPLKCILEQDSSEEDSQ